MTYDSTAPYPRDLVGYGAKPPHPQWPGGARIAVQIVLNYEEGGENSVLHGDAGPEKFPPTLMNPAGVQSAAHEHGAHLRVRLPRRGLADAAGVRAVQSAADRVRRE